MKLESKQKDDLKGTLVAKKYIYLILFFFLFNCSLNPNSKFWAKEKKILVDKSSSITLTDKEKSLNEFNQNFKISLPKNLKIEINRQLNNDGYINFDANLEKMSKYNFKRISKFSDFEPEILLDKNQLFYFDSSGSIIKFDNNSNVVWKQNFYSKIDKNYNQSYFLEKWRKFICC